jgi:hypothetical protein
VTRAYLWIAACAGCNSIFGLDDDARFVLPDSSITDTPPGPTVKTCLSETFDQLDTERWDDLAAPEAVSYGFSGGAFLIQAMGAVTGTRVGIVTRQPFDLVGGAVEIRVANPSTVNADGGVLVRVDNDTFVALATNNNGVRFEFKSGVMSGSQTSDMVAGILRLRHDAAQAAFVFEVAPKAGEPFTAFPLQIPVPTPTTATVEVYGRQNMDGDIDNIILDDLTITANCL